MAVLHSSTKEDFTLREVDLEESFTRGSGAGGQHRNKTDTAVRLKHIPTGIQVKVDGGRSQSTNRATARELLTVRVLSHKKDRDATNARRKEQVGSGQRGDKIRTVSIPRDEVVCHVRNTRTSWKRYKKGDFSQLA